MKHSFLHLSVPHAQSALLLFFCWFYLSGMAQTNDRFPLIKVKEGQLVIGDFSVAYKSSTYGQGESRFTYDSIADSETFLKVIDRYFTDLQFDDKSTYAQLQDSVKGWKFEKLIGDLEIDDKQIDQNWKLLPLRDALGSSLITITKQSDYVDFYIQDGKVKPTIVQDQKHHVLSSNPNFIVQVDSTTVNDTTSDIASNEEGGSYWWLWLLVVAVLIGAGILGYLKIKQNSLSINELQLLMEEEPFRRKKKLSKRAQEQLEEFISRISYWKDQTKGLGKEYEEIVLGYKKLEQSVNINTTAQDTLTLLDNHLGKIALVKEHLSLMKDFLEKRDSIATAKVDARTTDSLFGKLTDLLNDKANGNAQILNDRFKDLKDAERDFQRILGYTKAQNGRELLEQLEKTFNATNAKDKHSQIVSALQIFDVDKEQLQEVENMMKSAAPLANLAQFLAESDVDGNTVETHATSLENLQQKLLALVPESKLQFEALLKSTAKAHLFAAFFKALQTHEMPSLIEARPVIIEEVKTTYQQQIHNHVSSFDMDQFLTEELIPHFEFLMRFESDFSKENRYLLGFNERFKDFTQRLERSASLTPEDKRWLFQQMFTMTFHFLDYLKIKLSQPKTIGTDRNYEMILNQTSVKDLSKEEYRPMTQSIMETPFEVLHILDLAKEVNIESLEEVLFYGMYINPEQLKDKVND